jgi:hypothetical protein
MTPHTATAPAATPAGDATAALRLTEASLYLGTGD